MEFHFLDEARMRDWDVTVRSVRDDDGGQISRGAVSAVATHPSSGFDRGSTNSIIVSMRKYQLTNRLPSSLVPHPAVVDTTKRSNRTSLSLLGAVTILK